TKLIGVGAAGAVLSMVCFGKPLLAVLLAALGLTAFVAKLCYVLVPLFLASLALVIFSPVRPRGSCARNSPQPTQLIAYSTVTRPPCGHQAPERMPQDACLFFYDCKGCGQRLKPQPGDCCVFCSYGSVPCPPVQAGQCGG